MCRGTVDDGSFLLRPPLKGRRRLELRAFYLRLSSTSSTSSTAAPAELTLVYRPPIGGAALELGGRALPPATPASAALLRVRDAEDGRATVTAPAYASADRVSAADGARFEVYADAGNKELIAEGVFARQGGGAGGGWRVECRRPVGSPVAEVVVLAEGGVLLRARARASSAAARRAGCLTRLEGIPEEEAAWGACGCGACGEDEWEVVGDDDDTSSSGSYGDELKEAETVRWALEMGAWAVCVGVGLLATARRFSRKRALR